MGRPEPVNREEFLQKASRLQRKYVREEDIVSFVLAPDVHSVSSQFQRLVVFDDFLDVEYLEKFMDADWYQEFQRLTDLYEQWRGDVVNYADAIREDPFYVLEHSFQSKVDIKKVVQDIVHAVRDSGLSLLMPADKVVGVLNMSISNDLPIGPEDIMTLGASPFAPDTSIPKAMGA